MQWISWDLQAKLVFLLERQKVLRTGMSQTGAVHEVTQEAFQPKGILEKEAST